MFTIKMDTTGLEMKSAAVKRQMPFATMRALNDIAKIAQRRAVDEMRAQFDRPTPWILNSTFVTFAKKKALFVDVGFKNDKWEEFKSQTPTKYMWPHVKAGMGTRAYKRGEERLMRAGILHGMFYLPGKAASRDGYGNMSKGQITQVFSTLGALNRGNNTTGRSAKKNKKPRNYFIVTSKRGGLAPGVWELPRLIQKGKRKQMIRGRKVRPILIFVRTPQYKQRVDFTGILQAVYDEHFEELFRIRLREALRTARPL